MHTTEVVSDDKDDRRLVTESGTDCTSPKSWLVPSSS